jgi:hypothetical protein
MTRAQIDAEGRKGDIKKEGGGHFDGADALVAGDDVERAVHGDELLAAFNSLGGLVFKLKGGGGCKEYAHISYLLNAAYDGGEGGESDVAAGGGVGGVVD